MVYLFKNARMLSPFDRLVLTGRRALQQNKTEINAHSPRSINAAAWNPIMQLGKNAKSLPF